MTDTLMDNPLVQEMASFSLTDRWDDETIEDYLGQLAVIGIRTPKQFQERFTFISDDRKPFEDFAWNLYYDLLDLGDELIALKGLVIDWQATWDCYLSGRYDYFRFDDSVHFYKQAHLVSGTL